MGPIWVALAIILVATIFDLRTREVPDSFSAALLAWAILVGVCRLDEVPWGARASGLAVGFLVGAPLFALGGLGGADVKLLAALGAVVGQPAIWSVLFWMAIAGGVLSVVASLRKHRDLAYLPAIALGLLFHILRHWRGGHGAS